MPYRDEYESKIMIVRNKTINKVCELINENINQMFTMWLTMEADIEDCYVHIFKEEFGSYIDAEIEQILWDAAHNINFVIQTYITINRKCYVNKLLQFVRTFMETQFDDFGNWCELSMRMYEASSEYERDNPESKEDNPE